MCDSAYNLYDKCDEFLEPLMNPNDMSRYDKT